MRKRTKLDWLHTVLNSILGIAILCFFIMMLNGRFKYDRPCKITAKYETGHDHKSHHYTEYYLTVKWLDRERNSETFDVSGRTYVTSNIGEYCGFKRNIELFDSLDHVLWFMLSLMLWVVSVCLAFGRRS